MLLLLFTPSEVDVEKYQSRDHRQTRTEESKLQNLKQTTHDA
jgi:hypothetical protein